MTISAELTRFLADHATAESQAAFAKAFATAPTAADLAAAMNANGYRIDKAELVAVLELSKKVKLSDDQLGSVVGGEGPNQVPNAISSEFLNAMANAHHGVLSDLAIGLSVQESMDGGRASEFSRAEAALIDAFKDQILNKK
jgi:hypothetical protein